MLNNRYTKIRGEFSIMQCNCPINLNEGLTLEISIVTRTDTDLDDDIYACEKMLITFRANRAGWTKVYRYLRRHFKRRIHWCDQKFPPNLKTRLYHKQLSRQFRLTNQGASACA